MRSSVPRSRRAIAVNVQVMHVFVRRRQRPASSCALARKLNELERKYRHHNDAINATVPAVREVMSPPAPEHRPVGFTAHLADDSSHSDGGCCCASDPRECVFRNGGEHTHAMRQHLRARTCDCSSCVTISSAVCRR